MSFMVRRPLTLAQMVRLERLAEDMQVIGWNDVFLGPIVRYPNGALRIVKMDGRLKIISARIVKSS